MSDSARGRGIEKCLAASVLLASFASPRASAQADPDLIHPVLTQEIVSPSVAVFEMKRYILGRVAKPPVATTAAEWSDSETILRRHLLDDVVYHGWPQAWVDAPPRFEDLGVIEGGPGYRLRKLRYEIVPGFQSVAILYEPEHLTGKAPAILNVHGHVGAPGKAVEYKQKRCINFARHGVLALNLEWFDFGELAQPENSHWFGAHLDLVGANALGLFYLEMRRGLDYLASRPDVDPARLGVTGLSGGGWQTLILSALDERVAVAVPVAGYSSVTAKVEAIKYGDLGDLEQSASDLLDAIDYTHLTALRAPRPTLLIHNAEDDCCYRAPLVKPLNYDAIRPFFKLYGKEDNFAWHENRDPGTHNYQLDNRLASYRFFSAHFHLPPMDDESGIAPQIKSYDQLVVGLPKDNLTILGLARELAKQIQREPAPADPAARSAWAATERRKLSQVVRLKPVSVARAWRVANTKDKGIETLSYLFETNVGLSANGVWLKGIAAPEPSPLTIVLNDQGRKAAGAEVSDRVNHGEQVLVLDLLFMGEAWKDAEPSAYAQILDGLGDRPLGLQAGQLIAIAQWMKQHEGVTSLRLEATGMRSQVVAMVTAALEPSLFSDLVVHQGVRSLGYLLAAPVTFQQAPELFCLDLYKSFDINNLSSMASPTEVEVEHYLEVPKK